MRIFFVSLLLGLIACFIGGLFWYQEMQYALPTPVPENYKEVSLDSLLDLQGSVQTNGRPVFLHFYNPDCPCSRFNMKHFNQLTRDYGDSADFYTVVPHGSDLQAAAEALDKNIPVVEDDSAERLTKACGVIATPQAVVIDEEGKLFYRGNFNKARYCTTRSTNFAELALQAVIKGEPLPEFSSLATVAYGCSVYGKDPDVLAFIFGDN